MTSEARAAAWNWDQGRLAYFQFDALRKIAKFVTVRDFMRADKQSLFSETGLSFQAPSTHSPWRNYSRVLKLCLLVSVVNGRAEATPVARILSQPGVVTCDEYLHFLVCASSSPSPALQGWLYNATFRYPLLFSLKYLLTKAAIEVDPRASLNEIMGAYRISGFTGDEDDNGFIAVLRSKENYESASRSAPGNLRRQAAESLRVIAQISYLHIRDSVMNVSLDQADAREIFADLAPVGGSRARNREAEIRRLAELFGDGSTSIVFDYPHTIISDVVESGFQEGNKVKKTHITIERNASLRSEFFRMRPTAICDVCALDTAKTYPWTKRVLDLHHLLALSSGTRVEAHGTTFDDLVPVCPNCHRAVHRFYDQWLDQNDRNDFLNSQESRSAYEDMKAQFPGFVSHA